MSMSDTRIAHRRHTPFYAGGICAAVTFAVCLFAKPPLAVNLAAVVFFLVYLLMIARRIPSLTGAYLKHHAARTDEPAIIIFAVTLATAAISLVSLFMALNTGGKETALDLVLAFSSVTLGWLTVHTMAAMHYAHSYWRLQAAASGGESRGLEFPGTKDPGGYDFLYFSFVIGMTAQTSDIAITSTEMRKINLLHAVVSFFFNTVLVAAAVNAAVSLA